LQADVADLTDLTTSAFLRHEHVAQVKERWANFLLDRYMNALSAQVESGRMSDETYSRITELLAQRLEAADFSPDAQEFRDRLAAALTELYSSARDRATKFQEMRLMLIRDRLNRAIAFQTENAGRLEITREQYNRIVDLYADVAKAEAGESLFPQCVEIEISDSLDDIGDSTGNGSTTTQDLEVLGDLVSRWEGYVGAEFPSACEIARRLQADVADMTDVVTSAFLRYELVAHVQERWIDFSIDLHMNRLGTQVRAGELSAESFGRISALLEKRAEAAASSPPAQQFRDRLLAVITEIYSSSRDRVEKFEEARLMLIRDRLERAVAFQEENADRLELTREQYNRIVDLFNDVAQAEAGESYFPTCDN
jgi:hypothetical protein